MTDQEFDVVVVGSGGAGMVAALAAAHRGLNTIIVEKAAHFGGSTAPDAPTVRVKVVKTPQGATLPGYAFTQEGSF